MLYVFFWVIIFGTLCLFHLHRVAGVHLHLHLPAYEDGTDRVFRNVGR